MSLASSRRPKEHTPPLRLIHQDRDITGRPLVKRPARASPYAQRRMQDLLPSFYDLLEAFPNIPQIGYQLILRVGIASHSG